MQTIQQQRAAFALARVQSAANNHRINNDEYNSHASALPAMIHMNGLGQAAAFYKSKSGSEAHKQLYQLLSDWLKKPGQPYEGQELMAGITGEDMHRYRLAQAEAQALMDWVKKFASAFMTEEK